MLNLNLTNVEELIFYDKKAQAILPDFSNDFRVWAFALRNGLVPMGRKVVTDFLSGLKDAHVEALETYFGDKLVVDKLDYHMVRNYTLSLENAEEELNQIQGFPNLSIHRSADQLYISFWR